MGKPSAEKDKKLTASLEDYLESILLLVRRGRVARVRDIAARAGVGMPSVTAALKALSSKGLVNYDPYQVVTLTAHGRELAEDISKRHVTLRRFLVEVLGLDGAVAEANACRMEHAVDNSVLGKLAALAEFLRMCPQVKSTWLEDFENFCELGVSRSRCRQCMADLAERFDIAADAAGGMAGNAEL